MGQHPQATTAKHTVKRDSSMRDIIHRSSTQLDAPVAVSPRAGSTSTSLGSLPYGFPAQNAGGKKLPLPNPRPPAIAIS